LMLGILIPASVTLDPWCVAQAFACNYCRLQVGMYVVSQEEVHAAERQGRLSLGGSPG